MLDLSDINALVVEDEPVQQKLMGLLLYRAGLNRFQIIDNIEEAERLLRNGTFNIVLLDNDLQQEGDGRRLIAIMREIDRGMYRPYVMISGDDTQALRQFCEENEVLFLHKDDLSVKTLQQAITVTLDL